MAGLDGVCQSLLIHQATAGGVDDDLTLLGFGKQLGIEHAGGFLGLGQVDGDEVGATHEVLQVVHQFHAQLCGAGCVRVRIVGDDVGLESCQALRKQLADVAEADDADGLVQDLHTIEGGTLPLSIAQGLVCGRDLTSGGEQQGHSVLTRGVDVGGRSVGHHHATGGGGFDVHVVQTHACAAHDLQLGCGFQNLGINLGGGTHEERIGIHHCLEQLGTVRTIYPAHLNGISKGIDSGLGKLIGNQNYRAVTAHAMFS